MSHPFVETVQQLLNENDFWVLASLLDYGFEDGIKKGHKFRRCVDEYEQAGMPTNTCALLRLGINGNLERLLNSSFKNQGTVLWQPKRGRDLSFRPFNSQTDLGWEAEVKHIYDCTNPSYYDEKVPEDWMKLKQRRSEGYPGRLFIAIFMIQLPHYEYPIPTIARRVRRIAGIEPQYRKVCDVLGVAPVWPFDGTCFLKKLSPPSDQLQSAVRNRWKNVFKTVSGFDFKSALRDSAVAACVWEYTK